MRKKFIAGCLTLALCFGLFSLTAQALVEGDIKYGRDPNSWGSTRFVTDGEYFYYTMYNHGKDESLPSTIIKESAWDNSKTVLHTESTPSSLDVPCLNLMDGYLYFNENDNIYKMRTDGTNLVCIYARDPGRKDYYSFNEEILIVNDTLYLVKLDPVVTHQRSLVSMNLDGSDVQTFSLDVGGLRASGDRLYLTGSGKVVWYDRNNGATGAIDLSELGSSAPGFFGISADGRLHFDAGYDWIFSEENFARYVHYSCNADGTDFRTEKEIDGGYFTIVGNDTIYRGHDGYIYKTSLYNTDTPVRITDMIMDKNYTYHNGYIFTYDGSKVVDGKQFTKIYALENSFPAEVSGNFSDVMETDYFSEPVKWALEKGITSGTSANTFSPNVTCTTAQILTFLWRANGSPEPKIKNPFHDVADTDYYAKAALWAKENRLVSGTAFDGNTPCTRSATVTYFWKLAGSPSAPPVAFTDVPSTADYAQAVAWAVKEGITSGTSATTFSPETVCSRGQIVTFLYRAYQ